MKSARPGDARASRFQAVRAVGVFGREGALAAAHRRVVLVEHHHTRVLRQTPTKFVNRCREVAEPRRALFGASLTAVTSVPALPTFMKTSKGSLRSSLLTVM